MHFDGSAQRLLISRGGAQSKVCLKLREQRNRDVDELTACGEQVHSQCSFESIHLTRLNCHSQRRVCCVEPLTQAKHLCHHIVRGAVAVLFAEVVRRCGIIHLAHLLFERCVRLGYKTIDSCPSVRSHSRASSIAKLLDGRVQCLDVSRLHLDQQPRIRLDDCLHPATSLGQHVSACMGRMLR